MPTNILRSRAIFVPRPSPRAAAVRHAAIVVGDVRITIALSATPTADRIWSALPLYASVEPWGHSIHFEIPVASGRDRTARLNARPGEVCFWAEEKRVFIGFGPTPISRPDEIRLMAPCNVWAQALDDVGVLDGVRPGARIAIERVQDEAPKSRGK